MKDPKPKKNTLKSKTKSEMIGERRRVEAAEYGASTEQLLHQLYACIPAIHRNRILRILKGLTVPKDE